MDVLPRKTNGEEGRKRHRLDSFWCTTAQTTTTRKATTCEVSSTGQQVDRTLRAASSRMREGESSDGWPVIKVECTLMYVMKTRTSIGWTEIYSCHPASVAAGRSRSTKSQGVQCISSRASVRRRNAAAHGGKRTESIAVMAAGGGRAGEEIRTSRKSRMAAWRKESGGAMQRTPEKVRHHQNNMRIG